VSSRARRLDWSSHATLGLAIGYFPRMGAARVIAIAVAVVAGVAASTVGTFALLRRAVLSAEDPGRPPSDNYVPVATDLALLAQTLDAPLSGMGHAWLPKSARDLHPQMAQVRSDGATLSWGRDYGGSLHLARAKDQDDAGPTTTWVLVRSDRNSHGEVARVTLPSDRKIPMRDFIERTQRVYADELGGERPNHFSRVEFALRFQDMTAVRVLLMDSVKRDPQRPEPRMALAFVDAAERRDDGVLELERWAKEKPSYDRWSDVALTYVTIGRVDPAIAALNEALRHPLTTDRYHSFNPSARACPVAELALAEGRLAAVETIASRLQKDEPEAYTRKHFAPEFRALRAAAAFRAGDRARAMAFVEDGLIDPDETYRPNDDPRLVLAGAVRANDAATIERWRPKMISDIIRDMVGSELLTALRLPGRRAD
jgi:hypothetical protein